MGSVFGGCPGIHGRSTSHSIGSGIASRGHIGELSYGVEFNTSWSDDLPKIGPRIEVPLHYALAEFDKLWETSPHVVQTFARHFSGAPFVEAAWWRCVGHNIEHHRLGEAYGRAVLAFAERCAMETRRPAA